MSEWHEVVLTDIYEISSGLSKPADSFGSGYPFLSFKDVFNNYFVPDELSQLVESSEDERLKGSIKRGDVFLTRTSETMHELGMSSVALKDYPDATFNGFTKRLRPKEDAPFEVYPEFIAYYLRSPKFRQGMLAFSTMSTRASLNNGMIGTLKIKLPPIETQKSIARVLKSLDDKIKLNRQINQTLEQIAQAIFKSWFVDFEPVKAKVIAREKGGDALAQTLAAQAILSGAITLQQLQDMPPDYRGMEEQLHPLITQHFPKQNGLDYWTPETLQTLADAFPDELVESELGEIPKGWEVGVVGDFIDFNPRRALKKGAVAQYLDMKNMPTSGHLADDVIPREFGSGTKFVNGDTLLARITPCLENGKTAFVDFLKEGEVGWGSTEYIVLHTKNGYPECLSYLLARHEPFRQYAIQSMIGTSGRQRANADALSNMPWVIPDKDVASIFGNYALSFMAKIKSNGDSNKALSTIRDSLLPKLLSGEITVEADNKIREIA